MTNSDLDPRLSHLSPEELETLMTRYYAKKERVDDLVREYNIDCPPTKLSGMFPEKVLDDVRCRYCDVPMIQSRRSRSGGSQVYAYCPECGHQTGGYQCKCWKCSATVDRSRWHQRYAPRFDLIGGFARSTWPETFFDGTASDLHLYSAVTLLALVRACLFVEWGGNQAPDNYPLTLNPLNMAPVPFAPTHQTSVLFIEALMETGLLGISELSENDAFEFRHGEISGYYTSSVRWTLTIQNSMGLIREIEDLARAPNEWPDDWRKHCLDMWYHIAFSEAEQFYEYCSQQRGLPVADENSVDALINNLLQDYSVAQCYNIIYSGARRTADFMVRTQCHPKHAANYMVGECQRWADRVRAENWEVKAFRRNYDLPRSSLSYVLFDVFLGIGEEGFDSVPVPGTIV